MLGYTTKDILSQLTKGYITLNLSKQYSEAYIFRKKILAKT